MIDLHVHSTKSDGTLTPCELVDLAIQKGLSAFALTDHDTVDGLDEIISYAEKLRAEGTKNVPEIIPGIEFSTDYNGKDIHIVGLYINYKSKDFTDYLQEFIDSREVRNKKMCEKMHHDGIDITYEKLLSENPDTVITRAHIAVYLKNHGIVKSTRQAFDDYVGDEAKYFVNREKVTPQMAIDLILKSDGIPVLAHPALYKMNDEELDILISTLKKAGLIGIETQYTTYSRNERKKFARFAQKYHLLSSGGSDFHGANKVGIYLGTGHGNLAISDDILCKLKNVRNNYFFTDLDGTLLLKDSSISSKMLEMLKKMSESGHHLIISSGRPLPSVIERKIELGLNFNGMYLIAYNGGLIYDCDKEEVIFDKRLSSEQIEKIIGLANKHGIHSHSYSETHIVGTLEDEEFMYYHSRIHMPFLRTDNIPKTLKKGTWKVQLINLNNREKLEALNADILSAMGDEVESCFSNDRYLEILPKGVNKGAALLYLEDLLSIPHSHTFAAGDENNDLSMIKLAGTGIAMINGDDEVKKAADIVTREDNNHDGLLEVLNKYFT